MKNNKKYIFILLLSIIFFFLIYIIFNKINNKNDINNEKNNINKTSNTNKNNNINYKGLKKNGININNYNKLLEKDKNKANALLNDLNNNFLSPEIFNLSLDYLLGNKKFDKESLELIKNINFYNKIIIKNNKDYYCDSLRYNFYYLNIKDYNKYGIYKKYLSCYNHMKDNYNFITNPLKNKNLINKNSINPLLLSYVQEGIEPKKIIDPRLYFMIANKNKLPSRGEFYNLLNKHYNFLDKNLKNIYSIKFILTRIGIDMMYKDISKLDKNKLLKIISNNFYDYLLIDRSIFRKKDYCNNILNNKIKLQCNIITGKDTDKSIINKYSKIVNEYLVLLYNNK